jgi:glycosyltransferase involved in cell wall biosynthesis
MTTPLISIIIPTFNEEKNIDACLSSIFRQNYPKHLLEVIVVDDDSSDRTLKIAKQYPVKILKSGKRHGEISKMIGFKNARGRYVMYLDADNELVGNKWFEKMIKPLEEEENIIGVFTWEGSPQNATSIERYLSFDPLQRDSIYQFFSPSIDSTIKNRKQGYWTLSYNLGKIPPAGRCLYRREKIMPLISEFEMFLELDFLVLLVQKGFTEFAYSYESGLYHHHARNLGELLRKRRYNLTRVYFVHAKNKLYTWFNLKNPIDLIKLTIWIIWANLIIPSVIIGIYKTLKYRDFAGMYEPIFNLLVTDVLIIEAIKDKRTLSLLK